MAFSARESKTVFWFVEPLAGSGLAGLATLDFAQYVAAIRRE
jgi:hypothetical protein